MLLKICHDQTPLVHQSCSLSMQIGNQCRVVLLQEAHRGQVCLGQQQPVLAVQALDTGKCLGQGRPDAFALVNNDEVPRDGRQQAIV